MGDRITLTIRHDFKGRTHAPSVRLDLDRAMRNDGRLPDFVLALAQANGINLHGYEYETLPFGEFLWSDAEGLAADCLKNGDFDRKGFEQGWRERERLKVLALIARKHLGIENLDAEPTLKQALLEAYARGAGEAGDPS